MARLRVPTGHRPTPSSLAPHPDLAAEQAHIDAAYERLEAMREAARERMAAVLDQGRGGTPQAKAERDVVVRSSLQRLTQLDLGDHPLCFGRIDRGAGDTGAATGGSYHIGRLGVSGDDSEPLVVDWRAPVAEPFYRATGRDPMGLARRRHFASEGRQLVGIEDELFATTQPPDGGSSQDGTTGEDVPSGALLAAMQRSRSGYLRDIVATVQREQDEIIRAPVFGLLVVQGGPGTGKTVVALHRAAYLLYTHRFPLEQQGVLVIGPNRLYLRYIEQVLPSLGENGVASSTVEGLLDVPVRSAEPASLAHLKGQARMSRVLLAAVRNRQRPLPHDLVVPYGSVVLRLGAAELAQVVGAARRRSGPHNARRRLVEGAVTRRLAAQHRAARELVDELRPLPPAVEEQAAQRADGASDGREAQEERELALELRRAPQVIEALDRMWPSLLPEELLHDLYGARALLALAGRGLLDATEQAALHRPRSASLAEIPWTRADIPLIDEARVLLGPPGASPARPTSGGGDNGSGGPRAYGHIVVDEAQGLSPMQLRMLARRSISASMTLVGDLAQATGPHASTAWSQITGPLRLRPRGEPRGGKPRGGKPRGGEPRLVELSVNYRTPAQIMDLAARVLAVAAPGLRPPRSVRSTGTPPTITAVPPGRLLGELVALARLEVTAVGGGPGNQVAGTVAVIGATSTVPEVTRALRAAGLPVANVTGSATITAIAVEMAKGLEFDSVIVLEPAAIVEEAGLRALYVALTRPTRRLSVIHELALPAALAPGPPGDVSRGHRVD